MFTEVILLCYPPLAHYPVDSIVHHMNHKGILDSDYKALIKYSMKVERQQEFEQDVIYH